MSRWILSEEPWLGYRVRALMFFGRKKVFWWWQANQELERTGAVSVQNFHGSPAEAEVVRWERIERFAPNTQSARLGTEDVLAISYLMSTSNMGPITALKFSL